MNFFSKNTFIMSYQWHFLLILSLCLGLLLPGFVKLSFAGTGSYENYTYKLTQSSASYDVWTTLPSERVFKDTQVPESINNIIRVYAAKNEFEPFQVVIKPKFSGNLAVNISDFGAGISSEIYQVKYVQIDQASDSMGKTGPYPDPLWPIEKGAAITLSANQNTAFWFNLSIPDNTPTGDYSANVTIGSLSIPIELHVFNFAIPDELSVKSQMNFSHNTILNHYSVSGTGSDYWMSVDKAKQFFIDHRLTPKNPVWPGGVTSQGAPFIDYNCNTHLLSDSDGIWGFEDPANKYLNGAGFNNGTGFPSFMAATFSNNDAAADQRPDTFCGTNRSSSDWFSANNPNSSYNQKWFAYMSSLESYLDALGYLDKSYYYFANEPQNQTAYDAVAWYSRYLKQAAPNLKLMISEEPKPEIYNNANYINDAQIDIWLPVFNNYDPLISHDRALNHDEDSWIYFLHSTRPPYFNPITLDHPGIESKFTGWLLWKYRIRGIAYYSLNNWSQNPWTDPMTSGHNGDAFMLYPPSEDAVSIPFGSNNHRLVPSIRFELMRDSLEDYEYLFVLNNSQQPEVAQSNPSDQYADKIINSLTSYTRDSEFMYNLRRLIGLYNGGEISSIADIQPLDIHPRSQGLPGNYYINFQDPAGSPTQTPLIENGHNYMKIGWNSYDDQLGYGWFGDMAHVKYQYLNSAPNELQKSILYDDWGREKVFEFDLPSGTYKVTVSVGWQDKTYAHHKIAIEGVDFINDEATTPQTPYLLRTKQVTISDSKLTIDMGIFNEYTMLNYINIEALRENKNINPMLYLLL